MVLTISVCKWLRFLVNWLIRNVAEAMFGLVSTMENMIDLVIP